MDTIMVYQYQGLRPEYLYNDKCKQTGVYKLKCKLSNKTYIWQTGRNFKGRYKEHIHNIKYNKENSNITHPEHTLWI